jgi:hypothetical protein
MIEAAGLTPDTGVLDVGGGDSRLVDALVAQGLTCLAVLDISAPVPVVSFGPARMPEAGHHDTRRDQRRVLRYPVCATPWLTVVADSESATRGRSMVKMQPWSGRLRA